MANIIADTGYWIENDDPEHYFSPELSSIIISHVEKTGSETVYDFGCGTGEYLMNLKNSMPGIIGTGFEGSQTNRLFNNIVQQDLSEPFLLEPADLSISIEVGEHIPKEFEQTFIDNISNNTKSHLIVSWAIEGQVGLGHVNCQNNDYVISQFEKRGWVHDSDTSNTYRSAIPKDIWLFNTLLVFNR